MTICKKVKDITIQANTFDGLKFYKNEAPLKLCLVDAAGKPLEIPGLSEMTMEVAIEAFKEMLKGDGIMSELHELP